jgi:hypothetical protein
MHKGRIAIAILAAIGVFSAILPWRSVELPDLSFIGFSDLGSSITQLGIDLNIGYVTIILFIGIAILALIGKKEKMVAKGFPKMGILVLSGLLTAFHLIVMIIFFLNDYQSPAWGLYTATIVSVVSMGLPYIFKADGTVAIPSADEIADDIEDSADIIEDKVEDIADKIEDKFDKDDEDDEDEEKEKSEEEKPADQ